MQALLKVELKLMWRDKNYVDGAWVDSTSSEFIHVLNPSTEEVIGRVPKSTAADVAAAVAAATGAFPDWSSRAPSDRVGYLAAAHRRLGQQEDRFVEAIVADVGTPAKIARRLQFGLPRTVLESYTDPSVFPGESHIGNSLIIREPIGVVGAITPWNYPLHQVVAKVAPALAAGCTVVLKPSEVTPAVVMLLAEVFGDVDLPPGVFNVVNGAAEVGAALVTDHGVDMVSFTGSTRAGREVGAMAARDIKRVALELGGKGANIVLPDVKDLDRILKNAVGNCFLNSGQTCLALTRLLIHESQYDDAVVRVAEIARTFTVGDPHDPSTKLGPMTSRSHLQRVRDYIQLGIDEGARLVAGGLDAPNGLDRGYFVQPTVFADVNSTMRIAREEIFGPVLSVMAYTTEQQAVEIANGTEYGLTAAVWSGDSDVAMRLARQIRAGQVDVNGGAFNPQAPFGGYKQSGNGRELGALAMDEYLEIKSVQQ